MTLQDSAPVYADALALYRQSRYMDCLEVCEQVLEGDPEDAEAAHLVGMLCFMGGDPNSGLGWFDKAIALRPDWAEAHSNRGLMLKNIGRIEDSLAAYRRALALDPEDAQAQCNFGVALRQLGEIEEAVAAFRRAVALNPMVSGGFTGLGLALAELGEGDEAVTMLKKAVAAFPHLEAPYRNLAAEARRQGRLGEAVDALRWGVAIHGVLALGRELALFLEEDGKPDDAAGVLTALVTKYPEHVDGWEALGNLHFRRHAFPEALSALGHVVALDPRRAEAHMRIHSVAQILGDRDLTLEHQRQALALKRLFTEPGLNPAKPQLLVLKAEGDWQANLPTDFILRGQDWGAIHYYYLDPNDPPGIGELPYVEAVFNAVAEPDLTRVELQAAQRIVVDLELPTLNPPEQVARTGRADIAVTLADLPGAIIPASFRVGPQDAVRDIDAHVASGRLTFPILVRPVGTHAGYGLTKVMTAEALRPALSDLAGTELYATNFVDTSGPDGQFRKFRVVVVDGEPYPFHMALSREWMVHYYNAKPIEQAAMDREEERFLMDFPSVFPAAARACFGAMQKRLGLDFFGVDCGLSSDGKMVLFEVDVGVIIHLMDDKIAYPYKHKAVPRIFDAVRAMIERRIEAGAVPA